MTAKEKSIELYNKFLNPSGESYLYNILEHEEAKECALIAVDEILEATKMHQYAYGEIESKTIYHNYWQEVKQELESL